MPPVTKPLPMLLPVNKRKKYRALKVKPITVVMTLIYLKKCLIRMIDYDARTKL